MTEGASSRPVLGVGAIVIQERNVLLVRRARAPRAGSWSLPGGRVELGEPLESALRREVLEETGLRVEMGRLSGLFEYIERDEEQHVVFHYVVADYLCRFPEGELRAGSDADAVRFVPERELEAYALNEEALTMIREAFAESDRR